MLGWQNFCTIQLRHCFVAVWEHPHPTTFHSSVSASLPHFGAPASFTHSGCLAPCCPAGQAKPGCPERRRVVGAGTHSTAPKRQRGKGVATGEGWKW